MRITETKLPGAFIVDPEPQPDRRGLFARTFSVEEFAARGLQTGVSQCYISVNYLRGTVRGLHYQVPPTPETKLVRCTAGAVYDVIVDMRPESLTYLSYLGVELSAENRRALYVPELFAHGYQTLTDTTEVLYLVEGDYAPDLERGVRYDDPAVGIQWLQPVGEVSDKDQRWPPLTPLAPLAPP